MNALHDVSDGYIAGCIQPEGSAIGWVEFNATRCRPCLVALIAAAVNDPTYPMEDDATGDIQMSAVSALQAVRNVLVESDPLRLRAEQALMPLCAGVHTETQTT